MSFIGGLPGTPRELAAIAREDLSDEEVMILKSLNESEKPVLPVKLAAELLLTASAVHKGLTHLEMKGLVVAQQSGKKELAALDDEAFSP
ncbi:MAG: hypothetical protein ACUVV0_04295 [Anaerolineae bacterium]